MCEPGNAVYFVDILQDVDGVHEERRLEHAVRRGETLVEMHSLRMTTRIRHIRDEAEMGPSGAKRFVQKLLDERSGLNSGRLVGHAAHKNLTFVHQRPDVLLRFHEVGNAELPFGRGLVAHPVVQDPGLFRRRRIFYEAVTPFMKVPPQLVNVLGRDRQAFAFPVWVLARHRCVVVLPFTPRERFTPLWRFEPGIGFHQRMIRLR